MWKKVHVQLVEKKKVQSQAYIVMFGKRILCMSIESLLALIGKAEIVRARKITSY